MHRRLQKFIPCANDVLSDTESDHSDQEDDVDHVSDSDTDAENAEIAENVGPSSSFFSLVFEMILMLLTLRISVFRNLQKIKKWSVKFGIFLKKLVKRKQLVTYVKIN